MLCHIIIIATYRAAMVTIHGNDEENVLTHSLCIITSKLKLNDHMQLYFHRTIQIYYCTLL